MTTTDKSPWQQAGYINRFKCRIGLHQWESDSDILIGTVGRKDEGHLVLIWWTCKYCAESKLKFIGR